MTGYNLPPGVSVNDPHINPPDDGDKLVTRTVYGRKARFHEGCVDSFREDRKHGLIYPPYSVDGKIMGVEAASIAADFCAYCGGH